eukprot:GHVS01056752.1.p1 GENE.GHVS01056752.1~~GHVS01056752.1.p1  ORF type:complete len:364 (-),score=45.29 GHVS01056752.1:453-1544(-)
MGMYHPPVLLANSLLWSGQDEWTNLFQKFHNRYQDIWNQTRHLAESQCVLLYAIPALRRDGLKNVQWQRCEIVYYCAEDKSWQYVVMHHIMYDPINGDSVFRVAIPKRHAPTLCFLKDKNSEDRDHPGGVCGEEERKLCLDGNYYCLSSDSINSLRDGEITEGDRISNLGISIRFQDSDRREEGSRLPPANRTDKWDGVMLHYLNESDGHWSERAFNLGGDMTVYLLEAKSVTFVIRDKTSKYWLKSPSGMDFRISFPGAYVVYSDGQLFECALQSLSSASNSRRRDTGCPLSPVHSVSSEYASTRRSLPPAPQVFHIDTPPNGRRNRLRPAEEEVSELSLEEPAWPQSDNGEAEALSGNVAW